MDKKDQSTIEAYLRYVYDKGHFDFWIRYRELFKERKQEQEDYDYKLIAERSQVIEQTSEPKHYRITNKGKSIKKHGYNIGNAIYNVKQFLKNWSAYVAILISLATFIYTEYTSNKISNEIDSIKNSQKQIEIELKEL